MELNRWQARFEDYLRLRHRARGTIANYRAELAPFFAFLQEQGVTSLGEVTRALVEDYRTHLFYATYRGTDAARQSERLTLRSQGNRLTAVKAFLRFLVADGYLLADPGAGVAQPRVDHKLPQALLTEEEVMRLLAAPDVTTVLGLRDRAVLEVLYGTGIRNGELVALKLDAVDHARGELRIRCGKGRKSRVVPLGEEALQWLEEYLATARPALRRVPNAGPDTGHVFLSWRGRPLGRNAVEDLVAQAVKRAGIAKKVRPHGLRHCCATHMLKNGAGLRFLQVLLGHALATTTQVYLTVEVSDLREVMLRCHPRERGPS